MASKHRASMVFKKCTFLPCKQAHALSWLGLKTNWEPKNGGSLCLDMHLCTHVTKVRQFGREMAQIKPPTHTFDPKPIYFCAEVFHILLLTAQNHFKWKNLQVRYRDETWPGMVGLTKRGSIYSS